MGFGGESHSTGTRRADNKHRHWEPGVQFSPPKPGCLDYLGSGYLESGYLESGCPNYLESGCPGVWLPLSLSSWNSFSFLVLSLPVLALPVRDAWRPSDITKFQIPTTSLFVHPNNTRKINPITMTSLAAGLNKILPSPRYSTEETAPTRASGARILGGGDADQAQLVLKVSKFPILPQTQPP